jgi:hypothetical protein
MVSSGQYGAKASLRVLSAASTDTVVTLTADPTNYNVSRKVTVVGVPNGLTLSAQSVVSGSRTVVRGTLGLQDPTTGDSVISLASSDPSVTVPKTITIPKLGRVAVFELKVGQVDVPTTVSLTASNGATAVGTATLKVVPLSAQLRFDPAILYPGQFTRAYVSLNAELDKETKVSLSSDHPELLPLPASVVIPKNTSSTVLSLDPLWAKQDAVVTAHAILGKQDQTAQLTLKKFAISLAVNPKVLYGDNLAKLTASLNHAVASSTTVTLKSDSPSVVQVPDSAVILKGFKTTKAHLLIGQVSVDSTVLITATLPDGTSSTISLSVTGLKVTPSLTSATVKPGDHVTLRVRLNSPAADIIKVTFPGLPSYLPGSLVIPKGSTSTDYKVDVPKTVASGKITITPVLFGVNQTSVVLTIK